MEFFAIFVSCSKKKIHGFSHRQRSCKSNKCRQIRSSRYFLRLDADEGAKISTLNKVYDRNKHLKDVDFLNGILDDFKIKFEIPEEDLKRLPKEGAYITISNHPLGGIDGVLLLKLMKESPISKL
jgi:hypothetical protein